MRSFIAATFVLALFAFQAHASFLDVIRALVTINPLAVNVSVPLEDVEKGDVFNVVGEVMNRGEVRIENGESTIFLPPELVLLTKNPTKKIGVIPAGKEKSSRWRVRGDTTGNYVVSIHVSGTVQGDQISAEESNVVTVTQALSPPGPHNNFFQRFFNIFRGLFSSPAT